MNTYRVLFEDKNSFVTGFNGTLEEAEAYYVGQSFQFGDTEEIPGDKMIKAVSVTEIKGDLS